MGRLSKTSLRNGSQGRSFLAVCHMALVVGLIIAGLFTASGSVAVAAPQADFTAAPSAVANAETITLTPIKDTWIWKNQGNKNFGGCDILSLDTSQDSLGNGRPLLQFDLSAIPAGTVVTSASLRLTKTGGDTATHNIKAYGITAVWAEGTGTCSGTTSMAASWSQRQDGVDWATVGGDYGPTEMATTVVNANGVYTWNLTSLVQSWVDTPVNNHGVLLGTPDTGTDLYEFASRENATESARPVLVVEYVRSATLAVLQDSYISQSQPDRSFGDAQHMETYPKNGSISRGLIQFESVIAAVPPHHTILSATLFVGSRNERSDHVVAIHRATADWNGMETNWTERMAGQLWSVTGGEFDSFVWGNLLPVGGDALQQADITGLVQGWYDGTYNDNGILLDAIGSDTGVAQWNASESNQSPPFIEVTYSTIVGKSIAGVVWDDQNRDGMVDGGEPGLANVGVAIYPGACTATNFTPVQSLITGSDGAYTFTGLDAAAYCVRVDENTLPTDYGTTANQNPQDVDFSNGPLTAPVNFGYASIYAADRLTVGVFAPCTDYAWLQSLAATHSATIVTVDTSACVFTLAGDAADLDALGAELASQPTDRYDHPDVRDYGVFTPNDPDYGNATIVYAPQQINAPAAWDITRGDPNLILAVIDTGIDFSHPEFAGRILPGYDFVNKDADPSDDNGHGTHVAGIAAAGIDNALGMAGHRRSGQDFAHQGAQRQQRGLDERRGRRHHLCRGPGGAGDQPEPGRHRGIPGRAGRHHLCRQQGCGGDRRRRATTTPAWPAIRPSTTMWWPWGPRTTTTAAGPCPTLGQISI